MRIENEEQARLIALHQHWLKGFGLKPDLRGADLQDADLRGADLQHADLWDADLRGADLRGADLRDADLRRADLQGTKLNHSIVPEKGEFIAYKRLANGIIAELLIPAKAKRVGGLVGRKCRAEFVKVIRLSKGKKAYGIRSRETIYAVGKITKADKWNGDPGVECTHGIHFFITRQEAENFVL